MKEYIRKCDYCQNIIQNMYKYGVTTLFRDIRIGRGHSFEDYSDKNIRNIMNVEEADDYDNYGKGWKSDDEKEFNFCSPDCLYKFFGKLFEDTYKSNVKRIKEMNDDNLKSVLKDIEDSKNKSLIKRFFDSGNAKPFLESAISELKKMQIENKKTILKLKELME